MLFDLEADPHQLSPIQCDTIKERMVSLIKKLMQENDAPAELYERFSLQSNIIYLSYANNHKQQKSCEACKSKSQLLIIFKQRYSAGVVK